MLKMVDGTGIIGVDMVCPLGGAASPPQPPNYDRVEMEGGGSLMLPNSLKAPLERVELLGNSTQGENPAPDNPQEIKSAGKWNEGTQKYEIDVKVTGKNLLNLQKESDVKGTYQGWKVGDGKKTIVLSIKDKGNNVDITKCSIGVSGNGINPNDGLGWIVQDGRILRSEIKTTNPYVTIYPPNETTVQKFLDRFEIQVEYGTTATPYQPYTEQTVQIALDEPLRGIRRITDGKNVQEALNSSGITRRFKEVEITKDTPITYTLGQYGAPETNTVICRYKDASLKKTGAIICGELKNINNWIEDKESVATTEQGIDFRLSRERLGLGSNTTPEENKVAVIKYLTDHPLHCVAELNEPITEPLPESVQQQLQALHSENGTTHVFVDSGEVPCGIKLTYRKEI